MVAAQRVTARSLSRMIGPWEASGSAYTALADKMRHLLSTGQLPVGARMPSERELSDVLPMSRTTVSAAYTRLRDEGILISRRGSGSWLSLPAGTTRLADLARPTRVLDLTKAAPSAPLGVLHQAMSAAASALPTYLPSAGYELEGLPRLRIAVAESYTRRGLRTEPDQIMVTNGALHGLALVLSALLRDGDRVLVESPTYPNALQAIERAGGRSVPVPLNSDGWDFDGLTATLRQSAPRLAFVVPDYHNPTGHLLDNAGRARLVAALRNSRTIAIVDETLAGLRLDGPATPAPVASFDETAISLGSMSKTCWGGLRIGWVRAEPAVIAQLSAVRPGFDLGTPVLEQLIACFLLEDLDQIVAPHRAALRDQRDTLARLLRANFPDWHWTTPHGGLALWVQVPFSTTALVTEAERADLLLTAGTRFGATRDLDSWLRLPFTHSTDTLRAAVEALTTVVSQMVNHAVPPGSAHVI